MSHPSLAIPCVSLFFGLLCAFLSSSCAHVRGVEKDYEKVTPIPGTELATEDAAVECNVGTRR